MKLTKLPQINRAEFPQDYKFSWIAYNVENEQERVLFDNHHGKAPHWHVDQDKCGVSFAWLSRTQAEQLFWAKVAQRFGSLKQY